MPYVQPDIDDDDLAMLLASGRAPNQAPMVPPGVNASLIQPPMVPNTALAKPAMSSGAPMMPNVAPAAPALPPSGAPMPSLSNPLSDTTNAVLAQRPMPPQASADPYTQKINDLQTQISQAKPKWWERALGGLSAGMIAYGSHDPASAVEIGSHVTNRQRENLQDKLAPLQQQESAYQTRTQRDFENKHQSFEDALKSTDEQRKQKDSDALEQERIAKAGRQDYLSMSPQERAQQVSQLEQISGIKFDDVEKSNFILTGKIPSREQKPSLSETIKQRDTEGRAAGLKGDDLMYYKLNGKLREPNPDAEARLEEARSRRLDSESRAAEASNNQFQNRVETYRSRKANITEREKGAFNSLEKESRDKTGQIKDEAALGNRKKTLESQYNDEFNALGPEPTQNQPDRLRESVTATPSAVSYKGKSYKVGTDKVTIGGKQYTVKGQNPKTGKLIVGE